jgi:hypothetical protein
MRRCGLDRSSSLQGQVENYCESDIEPSGCIKF